MENQNTYDRAEEIDLVSLLVTLARKYRQIIAGMLVGAVLLGAGCGVKNAMAKRAAEEANAENSQEYLEKKQELAESVERCTNRLQWLEMEQDRLSRDIQNADEYTENSVILGLDPYHVPNAKAVLYVSDNVQQDFPEIDNAQALLAAYADLLTGQETLARIAEQTGVDEKYLAELISVVPDSGAHFLTIGVVSDSEAHAEEILNMLLDAVDDGTNAIRQTIGTHKITEVSTYLGTGELSYIREIQSKFWANVSATEERRTSLQNDYTTAQADLKAAEQELASFQFTDGAGSRKSILKYTLLGALLGMVAVGGVVTVRFVMAGRVYSAEELHRSSGLTILGKLASERTKRAKGVNAWLNRLEKRPDGSEEEQTIQLIAAMVQHLAPSTENLLVAGNLPEAQLRGLQAQLRTADGMKEKTVNVAENVQTSPKVVDQITNADAILLVADCQTTRYADIRAAGEKIQTLGKKILGCVVYE